MAECLVLNKTKVKKVIHLIWNNNGRNVIFTIMKVI